MIIEVVRAQVASLRAQIGSIQGQIVALEQMLDLMQEPAPEAPTCPHLETRNEGTFGAREERCVACGALVSYTGTDSFGAGGIAR